jgi:hypothetical protein
MPRFLNGSVGLAPSQHLAKSQTTNILGESFGELKVVEPAMGLNGARWACECPNGHRVIRGGAELRRSRRLGKKPRCPECRRVER